MYSARPEVNEGVNESVVVALQLRHLAPPRLTERKRTKKMAKWKMLWTMLRIECLVNAIDFDC